MACNCKESKKIDKRVKLDLHKSKNYSTFRMILDGIVNCFLRLFTIVLGIAIFVVVSPIIILWAIVGFVFNRRVMIPLNLDKIGKLVRDE